MYVFINIYRHFLSLQNIHESKAYWTKKLFFFKRNQFVLTKTTLGVIIITRNDKAIHMIFILNCH
jgi:hypothetical protein